MYYLKLYDFCNWKYKCVESMTNRSGPLHTKEQSVVSSHIVNCSIDSYVLQAKYQMFLSCLSPK